MAGNMPADTGAFLHNPSRLLPGEKPERAVLTGICEKKRESLDAAVRD